PIRARRRGSTSLVPGLGAAIYLTHQHVSSRNNQGDHVNQQTPLHFVFYFAAPPDKVWEGFVSSESNRIIFGGAELEVDLKPGGEMNWVGAGADGKIGRASCRERV